MTTTSDEAQDIQDIAGDHEEHFEYVNVNDLHDDPSNLRETYDGIEDLAASIKVHGLKTPIRAYRNSEGHYIIEYGHRRKRALVLLGQLQTRIIVSHKEPLPEERIATMLIENGHRKDLNPMEQAFGLLKIRTMLEEKRPEGQKKVSDGEVGNYIGRNQVWVSDRFKLLELSPDDQQAIREGRMTLTEGKRVGGLNSGRNRPGAYGKKSGGYFTKDHELGEKAMKRCKSLNHKAGGPNYVAVACGVCWETVIRNDERTKARLAGQDHGKCGICGSDVEREIPE